MMENDPNKRPNSGDIFEEIKKIYNSRRIHCTSKYSVYRALLSFNIICQKIPEHMPREEQKILNMPITYTLKLALNDILVPKKENSTILNIRDILTYNNSKFIERGK